jgi:ABC-2 type transport system ATP-binding protein
MDEAERLCDRVAIVDHGKVIALGTPRELILSLGGEHIIEFSLVNGQTADIPAALRLADLPTVRSVHTDNGGVRLSVAEIHRALPALLAALETHRYELASLSTRHASLEDVFVNLTGRHLRDDEGSTP